jgi:mannose-1-phosphate guanylyltransferase
MKIIVFAGGVGSRLWPVSRKNTPKQFEKLIGDKSTLQQTIERLLPEFPAQDIYVATGKKYGHTIQEQLPVIPGENFILEPMMRDVGPAIGLVASILSKKFPDEPIAILWSDHIVGNDMAFRKILRMAEKKVASKEANFIFIAQKARFPNQNCGWIELGERVEGNDDEGIYAFERLLYRPSLDEAKAFYQQPNFVWNLGYFVTTPSYLNALFEEHTPDMYAMLKPLRDAFGTPDFQHKLDVVYPTLEKISFDDAILVKMKKEKVFVVSSDIGWSDVGTWDALKEALAKSASENVTRGNVMLEGAEDSLIFNYQNQQLLVGIDLSEMVIINTNDVILVCPKKSVPKIKQFVESLNGTDQEHLV